MKLSATITALLLVGVAVGAHASSRARDDDDHGRVSAKACELVCATSTRLVSREPIVDLLETRTCFGKRRTISCCSCFETGFRPAGDDDDFVSAVGVMPFPPPVPLSRGDDDINADTTEDSGPPLQPAFLQICIPTTPRLLDGEDVDFLHVVLGSLEEQINDEARSVHGFAGVNIVVYNTRPGAHPVFELNRRRFARHDFIAFRQNRQEWVDPSDFEPDNMHNPDGRPGGEVRHQTFDTINLLRDCRDAGGTTSGGFMVIVEVSHSVE